jgi:flagellar basal-body rod modification protein FlgD
MNSINPLGITPIDERSGLGQTGPAASNSSVLGKDGFLQLLVAQLSNQDPLNPLEGQEFASQLAQFSSVEELINIGESLDGQGQMNALLAQSMSNGVAAGLIGKVIEAPGQQISWDGATAATGAFELQGNAASVSVEIVDGTGAVVRTIEMGGLGAGEHAFEWDGQGESGAALQAGGYTTRVVAKDSKGDPVDSTSTIRGRVERVTFSAEGAFLWIGKVSISMANVRTVSDAT